MSQKRTIKIDVDAKDGISQVDELTKVCRSNTTKSNK
jgi:hypothetical protein